MLNGLLPFGSVEAQNFGQHWLYNQFNFEEMCISNISSHHSIYKDCLELHIFLQPEQALFSQYFHMLNQFVHNLQLL